MNGLAAAYLGSYDTVQDLGAMASSATSGWCGVASAAYPGNVLVDATFPNFEHRDSFLSADNHIGWISRDVVRYHNDTTQAAYPVLLLRLLRSAAAATTL
eukprot:3339805-Pleurochrysis_carterae.AAC.1